MKPTKVKLNGKWKYVSKVATDKRDKSGKIIYKKIQRSTYAEAFEEMKNFLKDPVDQQIATTSINTFTLGTAKADLIDYWNNQKDLRLKNPLSKLGIDQDTVLAYERNINDFFNSGYLNEATPLSSVDKMFVGDLINKLNSSKCTLSSRMVRFGFDKFHVMMLLQEQLGKIDYSPTTSFKSKTSPIKINPYQPKEHKSLTDEQMKNVFNSIQDIFNYGTTLEKQAVFIFELELATGARWGEVAALQWGDIDFNKKTINFKRSKSSQRHGTIKAMNKSGFLRSNLADRGERVVFFEDSFLPKFRNYIQSQIDLKNINKEEVPTKQVFDIGYQYCREILLKIKKSLDITDHPLITKDFKRYMMSKMRAAGADAKAIQLQVGHADSKTQDDYITFQADENKQITDNIIKSFIN